MSKLNLSCLGLIDLGLDRTRGLISSPWLSYYWYPPTFAFIWLAIWNCCPYCPVFFLEKLINCIFRLNSFLCLSVRATHGLKLLGSSTRLLQQTGGDRGLCDHSSPLIGQSLQPDIGHTSSVRHRDQGKMEEEVWLYRKSLVRLDYMMSATFGGKLNTRTA